MAKPSSVEAKGDQFPVTLSAPAQGFRRTFRNAQEVHEYLSSEVAFWGELQSKADGPAYQSGGQHLLAPSGQQAAGTGLGASRANSNAPGAVAALRPLLDGGAILSGGKQGKLLARLADEAPASVPYIAAGLATELRPEVLHRITAQRINLVDLSATLAGQFAAKGPTAAERAQLDSLLSDVAGLKSELENARRDFADWRESQAEQWEKAITEYSVANQQATEGASAGLKEFLQKAAGMVDTVVQKSEQSITEFINDSTEKTEKFKKQVRQDVVNEVPTTFWNAKAEGHRNVAAGAALAFVVVAGAGVAILSTQGVPLVAAAFHTIGGGQSESALLALVPLAFITIPALAFAWVLRHISRVLVQNLSLGADARLRGTITSTFRALAADRPMNEAELAIALQALFRPMEAKDHAEISPPNLADLLKLDK